MLWRDWRAGELRLLLWSVIVAIAALTSVAFFADRMSSALSQQARQLLGADAVLASDVPIQPEFIAAVKAAKLQYSETISFPSMVGATGDKALNIAPQLSSLKVVRDGYPLRGQLKVAMGPGLPGQETKSIPEPGTLWLDASLLSMLDAKMGDQLELGESRFKVVRVITHESDRGTSFANFAPRAMINAVDLPATRLIQAGSRVSYRGLIAGDLNAVKRFTSDANILRGQRFEDLQNGRPELKNTLDRAQRFLSLVALLAALIAATAIALASRRFAQRHLDGCAVMRAIGTPQRTVASLLILELIWVGLSASVLGSVAGLLGHYVLVQVAGGLINIELPAPSILPAIQGAAAGLILLLGFAALPIVNLAGVPPLRVLRRDLGAPNATAWVGALTALVCTSALLAWFAQDLKLAGIALGGFLGCAIIFSGIAWVLLKTVASARHVGLSSSALATVRVALANWAKRGVASIAQMVALAIAIMALLLLTVTRNDLLDSWRRATPVDAPNRFIINIQPDQKVPVTQALNAKGIQKVELSPMIRGRLIKVNGKAVTPETYADARAQRLLDREFNLSYDEKIPSHNKTIEGRWIDPTKEEVSVEQGIAQTLNLNINDELTFDVAGEPVQVRVVGLRKLDWDSMKVNFFMIMSPKSLGASPQTLITSVHIPKDKPQAIDDLVRSFPNLTVFDTDNILRQVQAMLDQVSKAVEFLFGFTLAAGILVLYAAQSTGKEERQRETGLMRALGASRRQLTISLLFELGLTGALAGLMASAGALGVGALLAHFVFGFSMGLALWPIFAGVFAGAFAAMFAGWWGLRSVVNTPPMDTLRTSQG